MGRASGRAQTAAGTTGGRRQLITLAVDAPRGPAETDLIRVIVGAARGVEAVERDPARPRVWVFASGSVDPEALCHALALWGYGAYVLSNQFTLAA